MGTINIPRDEQDALRAIDIQELDQLIERALREERAGFLNHLSLAICGPYVSARLITFDRAVAEIDKSKSQKKRDEKKYHAQRAGTDLLHAFRSMKHRMETEEKEGQLFYVDDEIASPLRFGKRLEVRVSYRWRRTIDDEWTFGSITLFHDVEIRPDYTVPVAKRKASAAKREQDLRVKLYRIWELLVASALYSVRDYLRSGGDGDAIPKTFQARVDSHTGGLDNYSTQFWREKT